MISINKFYLSTESDFALSTTTILFYKKEDKKTVKLPRKTKNLVAAECLFKLLDQVRFGS